MKTWQKTVSVIATFALLLNSLAAPLAVLAQEETPSPTPETTTQPTDTPTPTDTNTPEATVEATATPESTPDASPTEIVTPTPEVTPAATDFETSTPSNTPVVTQAPESNPTVQGPPTATSTATPEAPTENGHISATVLKDTKVDTSTIDQFDLTYQSDGSATISTDKLDYSPTDTAIITGVGFAPRKTYTINITSSDAPVVNLSGSVTANDKGEILYSYQLDGNYRPNYKVEVKDGDFTIASTTFTDTVPVTTTYVYNLQPNYTAVGGGGVWSAYYAPDSNSSAGVSPGSTAVYDGREAGIIKAGITPESDGHFKDEGLLAFKVLNLNVSSFASQTLTYDVENQTGSNPVWVRIRLTDSNQTEYQFVPTTNPASWHSVDAAAGMWQLMDNNGNAVGDPMTLTQVAAVPANAGLAVDRVYLTLGMGDSYNVSPGFGTVAWVDKVTIGGMEYDFKTSPTCSGISSFDSFTNGSVNGQDGWIVTGSYDQAIVDNVYGYSSFGCKSLRLSDSVTSGSFGDQVFAKPEVNGAGETSATAGAFSVGTRQNHFETQFDIASALPTQQQVGLHFSISPDRGDGSRMSYLRFEDNTGGIDVFFDDVQGTTNPANFVKTKIATGLDRTVPHTIKLTMDFLDGPSNDIIKVYIDGSLVHTGTSWENYYRYDSEASPKNTPRIVKTVLFRQSGTAVPADAGNGFLIDNFSSSATTILPDTTAPETPQLVSPISGIYRHTSNLNKSDWTDVTDPSSPVIYYYESSLSTATNTDGSFTYTAYESSALTTSEIMNPGEPEVTYYWHVKACDAVGNCSPWSQPWQINIDNTNPTIPTLMSPNNNGYLTTHNFTFQWNASTDVSPLTYEWEFSYQNTIKSDGSFTSQSGDHTNLSTSVYSPGTPDNVYYWHVRAIDSAGNKSAWSEIWKVTIDTTPPAVPTGIYFKDTVNNEDVACGGITSARNFDVYWNANTEPDFDHYEYTSYNADGSTGLVDQPFTTPYFNASWWTVPTEGTYGVQIRSVDTLGNKSAWSGGIEGYDNSCKYTTDWTAPTVHFIFPTPGMGATSFKAVFSENVNSTEATNPANYFLHNWPGYGDTDLVGYANISYDSVSYTSTVVFTTSGWYISPEQEWGVENVYDLAGNLQNSNPYSEYSTPMIPPVTTDSGIDGNWHNTPVTVNFLCTDNIGGSGCKNTYYTTDGSTPTTSSTSGNSITLSSDGIYTIKYFSIDNAGNIEGIKTASNTVKIDTTATTNTAVLGASTSSGGGGGASSPPVCNDTVPSGAPILLSAISNAANSITLTWNIAPNPVTYYLVTYGTTPGAQTYGNPNIGGQGTTSYTINGLSGDTTYYFRVRAGNGCTPGPYSNELLARAGGGVITGPAAGFTPGVLGVSTETLPGPTPTPTSIPTGEVKGLETGPSNPGLFGWIKTHKKIDLGIILILAGLGFLVYNKKKKNK